MVSFVTPHHSILQTRKVKYMEDCVNMTKIDGKHPMLATFVYLTRSRKKPHRTTEFRVNWSLMSVKISMKSLQETLHGSMHYFKHPVLNSFVLARSLSYRKRNQERLKSKSGEHWPLTFLVSREYASTSNITHYHHKSLNQAFQSPRRTCPVRRKLLQHGENPSIPLKSLLSRIGDLFTAQKKIYISN